ncbi:MAG: hypothetical protein IOC86_04865, partial [Aestuariivirga sp.]|nr:hypothetical protein [Aestuariivirga sp.]
MALPDRDDAWRREAVFGNYAERPLHEAPPMLRIWSYADRLSYAPGETLSLSVNTNARHFAVEIIRDGLHPQRVFHREGLEGRWRDTPDDCSVTGCGWPVSLEIQVAESWPSGGYIIRTTASEAGRGADLHEHFFLVRPQARGEKASRLLLIAATATWTAYNDWGGSNHYQGWCGPAGDRFSPVLSLLRPLARGFVSLPPEAPRAVLAEDPPIMSEPRYPHMEWAYANGYSKKYMSAGWASFERHFVCWAEAEGYAIDIISQTDLHDRPELLEGYSTIVMVGHDEYWSWEMRDAVDRFVERGGRAARFAGNFMWQIR